MATTNKRFVAKNGLDNNNQTITNIGAAGTSLGLSGTGDLTIAISSTATLTIPSGSDTLVTLSGVQTLTNKTISGSNNTLSNIGNGSLTNSSVSFNGVSVALGASGTLYTDDISEDGSPTNKYFTDARARAAISVTDSGGDGSLSYDSGTGVITYTGPSATEVRAHLSAGTGLTYTTGQFAIDSTVVTLTGTQTLENKTLTTPVISAITNTGTLTLPISTDTLVGRATTDTLSNKTISGASNTISNIGNGSLTNSSITINGTSVSLGGTRTLVTDDIAEDGSPVNLWYTDTRARNAISVTDAGGDGSLSYSSGVITYTGPSASEVRAHFSAGTGVTITSGQVAIGQAVATTDNVTFAGVTADNVRVGVTAAGEIDTSTGNLTIDSAGGTTTIDDNATVTGNLQVDGNLTVSGTTVTINATNLAIEDNMIYLNNGSTVSHPDLGFAGNYNDGTYRHAGLFRDATDGVWKFFHQYTPEPDASAFIDTSHGSFALAPIQASSFTGSVTGNASTATTWQTARTLSLTGDVTGTSAAFDGSGNISISTTIAADSVALGTDTTGNYVASITNGNYITGGNGGSEGAALTLAVDATSANTASKVVARDASGNFSAGTITATLSGNASTVTNGVYTTDTGTVTNTMLAGSIANNKLANSTISGISLGGNLATLTLDVSGTGLSGSQTYNGSGAATFTVTSNATSANTASTIVARDASGNFTAGTITAALNGNASTATTLQTARNINGVSFNGSADITVADSTKLPLTGGTLTGKTTFPSAVNDRPQFPGGILGLDTDDGNFDIWGISRDYYPSHATAINAWGIRWDGDSNQVRFIGAGTTRLAVDLDGGASGLTWEGNAILHAGNYNSYAPTLTGTGASGTWGINITGNAATATSATDSTKLPLAGGTMTGVLAFTNVAGNKIDLYHSTTGSGDRYGFSVQPDTLRIFQGAAADATGGIAFGRSATSTFTEYARFSTGGSFLVGDTIRPSEGGTWNGTAVFGINGSNKVIAGYLNSTTTGAYIAGHNSAMTDWATLNIAGKDIIFRYDQTERMRLDGANGRLGIGTSSPATQLHIKSSGIAYQQIEAGGTYAYLELVTPASSSGYLIKNLATGNGLIDKSLYLWNGSGPIQFVPNNTIANSVTISTAGYLGIGLGATTSPAGPLHVVAGNSNVQFFSGASNQYTYISIGRTGSEFEFGVAGATNQFFTGTVAGDGAIKANGSSNKIHIGYGSGAPALTVNASNNVGIGTTSPAVPLHIDANTSGGTVYTGYIQNSSSGTGVYNVLRFFQGAAGSATGMIGTGGSTTGNTAFQNTFVVGTQSAHSLVLASNDTGRVWINSSGNVGIGTASPSAKLHVAGGAIADSSLYIGTTSSYNESTFEIRKNGIWDGPCITLYQTGTGGQAWSMFSTNSSFSQGAGKFLFYNGTGAGDVAVFDSSGNMGIGIMTPSARLHTRVNTASDDTAAIIEGTGALGSGLHLKASGTSGDTWRLISTGTSSTPGAGSLGFYSTNGASYRAIFSAGNTFVFGDTDLPYAPAWPGAGVFGGSGGDKVILGRVVSSYTGAVVGGHNDALSAWATLNLDGNGNIVFREAESEKMRLQSGNLGIGTSSPGQRLQVNGTILANPGTSGTEYRDIMVGGISGWSNAEAHGIEAVYNTASSPLTFARFDMYYDSSSGAGSFRWGKLYKSAQGSGYVMTLTATTTTTADLSVSGNITASANVTAYSDVRLKKDINIIENALEKVMNIRGVTFTRTDEDLNRKYAGVIAQEIEPWLPEVVQEDVHGMKHVAYGNITALLIEAIKELKKENELLTSRINKITGDAE